MNRIEIAAVALGALLITAGVAFIFWPAALIVAGALLVAFFFDWRPAKGGGS